ncbi:hypothetical protein SEA_OPIE_13 [Gordonia phage Opie]|nr:hypothetical protein SEA_OPIE_13 [Gordonia phage Opie]
MNDRVPTEEEMRAKAVELEWLEQGQPIPPPMRSRLARRINTDERAAASRAEAAKRTTSVDATRKAVTDELVGINGDLIAGGVSDHSAGRVLAALAPLIWRISM